MMACAQPHLPTEWERFAGFRASALAAVLSLLAFLIAPAAQAQDDLARETARVEDLRSIREIKRLQAQWGYLAMAGDWKGMAALGTDAKVDVVIVASATREVQQARVLARAGMTPDKLDRLLERQVPDAEQRQRADFVVDTSGTFAENNAQIDAIIARLEGRSGGAYNRHWA